MTYNLLFTLAANHAEDLANVVQKAVILCEVASLARTFQIKSFGGGGVRRTPSLSKFGMSQAEFDGIVRRNVLTDDDIASGEGISNLNDSIYSGGLIIDPSNNDPRRGTLDQSQRMKINELLGAWYVECMLSWKQLQQLLCLTNCTNGFLLVCRDEPEAEVGAEVSLRKRNRQLEKPSPHHTNLRFVSLLGKCFYQRHFAIPTLAVVFRQQLHV